MIKDNLSQVRARIDAICSKLNKNPAEVTLVCVTKESSIPQILEAAQSGITDIGENRIQDAWDKFDLVSQKATLKWHMIGHLQTNKVRQALKIFDMIHSVDSLRLAQELSKEAQKINKNIDILIQVNSSGEKTKFGIKPQDTTRLINDIANLKSVSARGLMTIAPLVDDPEKTRPFFRSLRVLRDRIADEFKGSPQVKMDYLSMGMSQDFEVALEEGSNMLRIGSLIFKKN